MADNYEMVQKGFSVLHPLMADYIGYEMNKAYRGGWWNEVLIKLNDQYMNLPKMGQYDELIDSLDVANCLRLIDREWNDVFRNKMELNVRNWAKELMGVRNNVAHRGSQDMSQMDAERALDTMARLCDAFDREGAEQIREIYKQVRFGGEEAKESTGGKTDLSPEPTPIDIPGQTGAASVSKENGAVNLIALIGTDAVQKTTLTRKVTFAGKTAAYPVYKVRLDALYYNDQNDRISTWITHYCSENGADALTKLNGEEYNDIIENFVYESNPESIQKTQKNITLVGQREPGVALADGRIVDGNRRYTCLRRIQRENGEPIYFETVIMDVDIQKDKKQIKILELAIQHGEEKKVDYDLIDYAIGTYNDVVKTKLLTIDEYASSTNESVGEVKKRIAIAEMICEFLEYIGLPEQYHIARMFMVRDLFKEMMLSLNALHGDEQADLKVTVFNNILMKAPTDQRKFIRDIRILIKNNYYKEYFEDQREYSKQILMLLEQEKPKTKEELDKFAADHSRIAEDMDMSLQRALLRSRNQQLIAKPAEKVSKSIEQLTEVDPRMFGKMDKEEKSSLLINLGELKGMVDSFSLQLLGTKTNLSAGVPSAGAAAAAGGGSGQFRTALTDPSRPFVVCTTAGEPIKHFYTSLSFTGIALSEKTNDCAECRAYFVDEKGNTISSICELTVHAGETMTAGMTMIPDCLHLKKGLLVVQNKNGAADEAIQLIVFDFAIA